MPDHTPGPWIFNGISGEIHSESGIWICESPWQFANSEHVSNIRLILAAPDLLAACQALCAWLDKDDEVWTNNPNMWTQLNNAIVKATKGAQHA